MDYSKARDSSSDLYRKQYVEKRNWYKFAVAEFVIIVILVIAVVVTAMISKPYPWVVQVDEHGYEVSIGAAGSQKLDQRIVISRIGRFIETTRTVISDAYAQKALVEWAFSAIPQGSQAFMKLDEFYRNNDPYKRGREGERVEVQIQNVIPKSEDTFQADWIEKASVTGEGTKVTHWTGLFTIAVNPTKDIKLMIKNPLGVYIKEYSIVQEVI